MSYNDERIDFDEIFKQQLSKIFPIFRFTNVAKIFTAVVILGSLLYPLLAAILISIRVGGFYGAIFLPIIIGLLINIAIFGFLYNLYQTDNMTLFWVLFAIELGIQLLLFRNWAVVCFMSWIALSVYLTKKAEHDAMRRYSDLSEARRYSMQKEETKLAVNGYKDNSAPVFTNPGIDNANLFSKKEEDIELVSMENVFARPASYNPEPEEYKISPMATFVDREKAKAAAAEAEEVESEAPADDVPAPVEGRGGILFCPKCTFSLLPGETKCPRCSK